MGMTKQTGDSALESPDEQLTGAFYQGDAEGVRAHLQLKLEELSARREIATATGISDGEVLAELAGLGIRVDTLTALTLIPLIDAAWADGEMDERERDTILTAAGSAGIEAGSASHRLLEIWTLEEPPPDLTNAWKAYVHALCSQLSRHERERLEANILGRARDVAAAAGDASHRAPHVSEKEQRWIEELGRAFHD
jgi:hypothetical protein